MFLKYNFPAFLWSLFILVLCGFPGGGLPHIRFFFIVPLDKWVHMFFFGTLCLLLIWGFIRQYTFPSLRTYPVLISFALCVFYGSVIEVLQEYFFSNRSFEWADIIADTSGSIMGVAAYFIYNRYKKLFYNKQF